MPRKKQSTILTTTWNQEKATILYAMQCLFPHDEDCRLPHVDDTATDALNYLVQRLSLTTPQVRLLSAVCAYNAARPQTCCDMSDLSSMLHLHPLEAMGLEEDLVVLEEKGYIYHKSDMDDGWLMESKAVRAMQQNQPMDVKDLRYTSNMEFLTDAHNLVKNGMCHDNRNTIVPGIRRLMLRNQDLPIVAALNSLHCPKADFWAMVLFLTTQAVEGDDWVDGHDIEQILTHASTRTLFRQMAQGTHPFIVNGYIEPYGADGMAHSDRWVLTRHGWETMLRNEKDVQALLAKDDFDNNLTPYTKLHKKSLFFSNRTQEQVDRLTNLLEDEQYNRIHQALKDKGMPTGFCCLFYGTPGTGKTECVQQLAIATGRDIMQVNIATLRDKYVGESEKRLKAIFDTYRTLVNKQKKAPILFFNEADAIFGNRIENTQRSVDKMENAMQNIILQEMETLDGILICTTNLTMNLDKAFDRRFLYKVEFERPTNEARQRIWKSMLENLTDEQAHDLAEKFDFSGGQIQNISRKQIINSIFNGSDTLDYQQIQEDCKAEKLSRSNGQRIGF